MKTGYTPPKNVRTLDFYLTGSYTPPTNTHESEFTFDRHSADVTGNGYLSGIVKEKGAFVTANVKILYNPTSNPATPYSEWELVAEVETESDGTWEVHGLNEGLYYDVIVTIDDWFDRTRTRVKPAL